MGQQWQRHSEDAFQKKNSNEVCPGNLKPDHLSLLNPLPFFSQAHKAIATVSAITMFNSFLM